MTALEISEIRQVFQTTFDNEVLEEIINVGHIKDLPEGTSLVQIGQYITHMPLLLEGVIKVSRIDNEGEEILLYFLEKGSTCAMSLHCCSGQTKSQIHAITETHVRLLLLPVASMDIWLKKYQSWRNFVLNSYQDKMLELLHTIDAVAFKKMDERLLDYLTEKSKLSKSKVLQITHQKIADDLHSSRVVISRLLKTLEKKGDVQLSRNSISLCDSLTRN